jgi:thioredoxin-like negative regulator of GroEL
MDFPVPANLQRAVDEADGWLDLRCPERALEIVDSLAATPESKSMGLALRIRANIRLGNTEPALADLAELRIDHPTHEWVDLTEAWCRRRHDDLPGAIRCIEQLLSTNHQHHIARFNLACYLALSGDADRAIDELSVACGLNPDCRTFAIDEPDFDVLRTDERFRQLLRPST